MYNIKDTKGLNFNSCELDFTTKKYVGQSSKQAS